MAKTRFIKPARVGTVKPAPRLSLCMIVRNSSATLGACLESIRPWVDEMVVVDTGSTDDTIALAKSYGASVSYFEWCDDFAAARNASLERANGQWLFWMDSDDTIDDANGRKLRALAEALHTNSPMAHILQVHCPGEGSSSAEATVVDHVKLFRNLPGLRFDGRIHEQVLPAIRQLDGEIAWTDIFVVHSGSDRSPEGRARKQERDLRLLELELRDKPDHPFVLFNLGMTYTDMGEHQQAAEWLKRSLQVAAPGESHVRKAYALLVGCHTSLDQYALAQGVCQKALQLFPEDPELQFRQGMIAHHEGSFELAIAAYEKALADREERHFSSIDRGITGFKARHNLAAVYADMKRHDLAELQWRKILDERPEYDEAWLGLTDCLLKQKRFTTLEVQLAASSSAKPPEPSAILMRSELAQARGDMRSARYTLRQGRQQFPADEKIMRAYCQFLFEQGPLEEASAQLRKLTQMAPHDAAAFRNLGTVCLRLEQFGQAAEAFQESLRLRPGVGATYLHLSQALIADGRTTEARTVLQEAAPQFPPNHEIHQQLQACVSV